MSSKIRYTPLDEDAKKISELVKNQRFRNPEAFIDRAIQILLAWERDPESSMDIMKGYPQTDEQRQILEAWLQPQIYQENFNPNEGVIDENQRLKEKNQSQNDHLKLIENLTDTRKYIKNFKIPTAHDNLVSYDQYPILFRFYSRFAPAKIVLCVLADLLRQNPTKTRINLKMLRADALDIAAEFYDKISEYEQQHEIKRTQKISTGFPKIGENPEENVSVHKRFRDQYIGKSRRNRKERKEYFEGILAALGLVTLAKEGKEEYVALTEIGKEFYLLDNPILNGDYTRGLSNDEAKFIVEKIIPNFILESRFHNVALETVEKYQYDPVLQQEPMTKILDQEIIRATNQYIEHHPEEAEKFDFKKVEYQTDEDTRERILDKTDGKYIEGWRVATMGRLVELKKVSWEIDQDGKSVFRLRNKKEIIA